MDTLRLIMRELDATTSRLHQDGENQNGAWTTAILGNLTCLGRNQDPPYFVCCSTPDSDCGEWLYDLCWLVSSPWMKRPDWSMVQQVHLVVECEWGQTVDEVTYDFQKLLLARSRYKVMVYQDWAAPDHRELEPFMRDCIAHWEEPPGSYLLARYLNAEGRFEHMIV
ncbi:MAG: hypothetical protein WDA75_01445 [Candidatus Latescibacterota bacterium]